jgi:hypothetical protein
MKRKSLRNQHVILTVWIDMIYISDLARRKKYNFIIGHPNFVMEFPVHFNEESTLESLRKHIPNGTYFTVGKLSSEFTPTVMYPDHVEFLQTLKRENHGTSRLLKG